MRIGRPTASGIAFSGGSPARIYRVNADGTGLVPLTTPVPGIVGDDRAPHWSPDGRQIGFRREHAFICGELWLMGADGSSARQVALPPLEMCDHVWSPDGKVIAFTRGPTFEGTTGIWLVNSDGTNPRPFTPNCAADGVCTGERNFEGPRWSPDARRIAYVSSERTASFPHFVHVSNLARTESVQLLTGNGLPGSVDWSPDGTKLAFTARPVVDGIEGPSSILVSQSDLSGPVTVNDDVAEAFSPQWRR